MKINKQLDIYRLRAAAPEVYKGTPLRLIAIAFSLGAFNFQLRFFKRRIR